MAVASLSTAPLPHHVMDYKLPESAEILSGWKDVANYMRMGVRTVQRYERDLGLPVRRPRGKVRASVVATKGELDAWVIARPARENVLSACPIPDNTALSELKRNVNDLRQLRQQSAILRGELHEAVKLLRENLRCCLPS